VLISLQITLAPIARGQIARLPVPADGSNTMSVAFGSWAPGVMKVWPKENRANLTRPFGAVGVV
jgi:hypothetical protein